MHEPMLTELKRWVAGLGEGVGDLDVADLGGRDFNGCLKDLVPSAVAFDVKAHESVDVVIAPGGIPAEHRQKYDVVVATNCLEYCENVEDFKSEALCLLKAGGKFFMSSCAPGCPYTHGLSVDHATEYRQYRKVTRGDLEKLFEGQFTEETYIDLGTDIIFFGRRLR